MNRLFHHPLVLALLASSLLSLVGCFGGPSRAEAPSWDPPALAAKAMELGDTNQDGVIAGDELDAVPGLKAGIKAMDTDADGKLTAEEIEARMVTYSEQKAASIPCTLRFKRKGRPLVDATIRLVPEPFLGGLIESAEGTTDFDGAAFMAMPNYTPDAVRCGFYRIEVTSASTQIPAEYNATTKLGFEAAPVGYPPKTSFDLK